VVGEDGALDEIDLGIVAMLQADCKVPLARIGEAVGLSPPSVMERVRKLEQAGVIRGYHADVDARRVGLDITAFVGVSINYPKGIDRFEGTVRPIPEVLECHHVTGGPTLLLKVKVRNTAALEQLISKIRVIEGVEKTETMVVLSTSTERSMVPIEPPADAPRPRRGRRRGNGEG
jgi:Lrp/AsnC family transcriptional regulator, leucine-responsive regulatory protein